MILASMIRLERLAMTSDVGFAHAKTSHCVAQLNVQRRFSLPTGDHSS